MHIIEKAMKLSKSTAHKKTTPASTDDIKTTPVSDELLKENLVISNLKNHPVADNFTILRTKVLSKMHANDWRVLAVTSPRAATGKSFVATNLAISIAMQENYSALLVDFDFRHPSLQEQFGITSQKGLSDFFQDDLSLSELLIRPADLESLVLLPVGKPINRSSELFSSSKMLSLLSDLKSRYSNKIIIVDLPPLLTTVDAITFLPNADACLLVVAEAESSVDDVERSMQLIDENKFLGSVFNKSTETMASLY